MHLFLLHKLLVTQMKPTFISLGFKKLFIIIIIIKPQIVISGELFSGVP